MSYEIFGRNLKRGDVVISRPSYGSSGLEIFVVIGFTNQNVKLRHLSWDRTTIKPTVVLVPDARSYFDKDQEESYKEICQAENIEC